VKLDVESLRTFQVLVDCGSVTATAERLHLTQSAVSWKMKRLEERLGAPLLIRRGREITLTELGTEMLVHANTIVSAHDAAVDKLQQSQLDGTVHLGTNDEIEAVDVATFLARFRRRHPKIRLHVRVGLSGAIAADLQSGELDIGLIQTLDAHDNDRVLWTESLQWIARPGYDLDEAEPIPLVTFGEACLYRPLMEDAIRATGRKHTISFECQSSDGVRNAILQGFGVGVLNERSVSDRCDPWSDPVGATALPKASFVVRRSPRSRGSAVVALAEEIIAGF